MRVRGVHRQPCMLTHDGVIPLAAGPPSMTETGLSSIAGRVARLPNSPHGVRMKFAVLTPAVLAAATLFAVPAQAQVEVQWWHAMGGPLGEWVNELAKGFNDSQKVYKIVP